MKNKTKGLFITLEGIEGAGKSTHMDYIAYLLKKSGKKLVLTREPGGTRVGENLRTLLLAGNTGVKVSDNTELLLMFAGRQQHLDEVIRPALKAGKTVLCDRFTDSTYAYQGGGRKIKYGLINQLVKIVHPDLKPDLTLLFDLPVELGLARANVRGELDSFESETVNFFRRVRKAYLKIAKADPERVKIINSKPDIYTVQKQIKKILEDKNL